MNDKKPLLDLRIEELRLKLCICGSSTEDPCDTCLAIKPWYAKTKKKLKENKKKPCIRCGNSTIRVAPANRPSSEKREYIVIGGNV